MKNNITKMKGEAERTICFVFLLLFLGIGVMGCGKQSAMEEVENAEKTGEVEKLPEADETEESMDDNTVKMYVLAADKISVLVNLQNDTEKVFEYGEKFTLQKKINGNWEEVSPEYGYVDHLVATMLPPRGCNMEEYRLNRYGDLKKGHYRIEIKNHPYDKGVHGEFDLE